MKLSCPHCNSINVRMIDHQPLALGNDITGCQFDNKLYGTFKCSDCGELHQSVLEVSIPEVKTELRILVLDVDQYDRKDDAEMMENSIVTKKQIDELKNNSGNSMCYTLSDFMDAINNDDFSFAASWMTYVRVPQ